MGILSRLFGGEPKPGRPRPTGQATFGKDVLSATRPVVVDFWAKWCAPCQVTGGLLDEVSPEYAGRIDFYKLDIDQSPEIAAQYNVQSIPTLVFFHQGAVVNRMVGVVPLNALKEAFDRLASLGGENEQA
jgi:thioredoxin 1